VVKEHGDEPNDRWKKIAVSATEQSERMKVPEISAAQALAGAVESASGEIWVAAERDKGQMLSDAARTASAEEISLFIGPEGGWSEEEMSMFREKGARLLSLGSRILRAETACVAACSIILIG
jgi:16S rRNA (uracil1498-N3)-methyltransferase